MNRKDIESRIYARAWADEAFKRELMADPRRVVEAEVARTVEGFTFPEGVHVRIIEETPDEVVLVLPVNPATVAHELRDEDLAKVSGGAGEADSAVVVPPIAQKGFGGFGIAVGHSPAGW